MSGYCRTHEHHGGGPGPRHRHGYGRGPRGFGGPGRRGPRARRGDVRTAILLLLAEEPRNGYGLMGEIEKRSGGAWTPSPGSVYPLLAQLEDEGLVASREDDGRKTIELTDAGREAVAARPDDRAAPWEEFTKNADDDVAALHEAVSQVAAATIQISQVAGREQLVAARELLTDTRRSLYRILSEDADSKGRGE